MVVDPGSPTAPTNPPEDGDTIRLGPSQGGTGANVVTPDQLQLDAANQLYLKKVYPGAAAEYEKYLGQYADAPAADRQSALWFMAECYRQLKRSSAAQSTYEQLLSKYDEGQFVGPASYQLADLYFEGKNYKAALPLFQRAASLLKPADALSARYYEALCLENLERRDETKEVYGNLIAVPDPNPYRELARIKLASLAALQKRPNEALAQYEALSKESTKPALRAEATIKAGLLARQLDQNDKAADYLERGSQLPAAGAALVTTAQVELLHLYYETNQPKRLITAYNRYARQLPEDRRPEAMLMAGNALRQQGRHQEAREIYDLILREAPNSPQVPDARYQRVLSLYAAKDPNFVREADDFLLLSSDPTKGDQVKLMKADTLFDKGDYAAAGVAYSILDGTNTLPAKYRVEIAYRLPYAYVQSNQAEKAVAAFGRFLKNYPESPLVPKALAQRALAFAQLKSYDSALSDFSRLIDDYPQARERELALQQKALLLGQREDARGMADTFRTLLREYPKTDFAGQARYYLGTAAYEAKDFANARTEFEAAAKVSAKEYGPRAALRVILCNYQLQDKTRLATDLDGYRRARFSPEPPAQVLRWLGERQMDDKNFADAEANLALAAASPSDDAPDTFLKLARCRLLLKRPEPALAAAESFLKKIGSADPGARANGLLAQGEAQLALKRFDDAQKSAEEAQTPSTRRTYERPRTTARRRRRLRPRPVRSRREGLQRPGDSHGRSRRHPPSPPPRRRRLRQGRQAHPGGGCLAGTPRPFSRISPRRAALSSSPPPRGLPRPAFSAPGNPRAHFPRIMGSFPPSHFLPPHVR